MILTITLNPAIDIGYDIPNFKLDDVNRSKNVRKTAGGKGLNVTRVIGCVQEDVCATGFLGGANGQFISNELERQNIKHDFVSIKGDTRNCIAILHDGSQTEILESGPQISEAEQAEFLQQYEKLVMESKVVVASGSLPRGVREDFYSDLILTANKYKKPFLLDTSGEALKQALKASPYLIKPNKQELSELLGKKLITKEDVKCALKEMRDFKVNCIVVSLGEDGAMVLCNSHIYYVRPPKIEAVNAVGSGDAAMAGFSVALQRDMEVKDMLAYGCTLGTLNAMEKQTGYIDIRMLEEIRNKTKVDILY